MLEHIPYFIIKKSFNFSVWLIERFYVMKPYEEKVEKLRQLPQGTLDKDITNCLDQHNLRLVPGYESHDLKHVLLGYEMTPLDEIRMQAFMLGNGNFTLPCIAILTFGAILLPHKWKILYTDYKKGKSAVPISLFNIEQYANVRTNELREHVFTTETTKSTTMTLKKITLIGAFGAIAAGITGMFYCLPYLYSSNTTDLIGAGFPFIGGSILTVGGLMVLASLSKQKSNQVHL